MSFECDGVTLPYIAEPGDFCQRIASTFMLDVEDVFNTRTNDICFNADLQAGDELLFCDRSGPSSSLSPTSYPSAAPTMRRLVATVQWLHVPGRNRFRLMPFAQTRVEVARTAPQGPSQAERLDAAAENPGVRARPRQASYTWSSGASPGTSKARQSPGGRPTPSSSWTPQRPGQRQAPTLPASPSGTPSSARAPRCGTGPADTEDFPLAPSPRDWRRPTPAVGAPEED